MRQATLIRGIHFVSFFLLLFLFGAELEAQSKSSGKEVLDTLALKEWPSLVSCSISPHGRYMAYDVDQPLLGNSSCIITDTSGTWRKEFSPATICHFSGDDRLAIFQIRDSLHILELGQDKPDRVVPVQFYRQLMVDQGEWLVYQEKGLTRELVLLNLLNGNEQRLGQVTQYLFDKNGTAILLEKTRGRDSSVVVSLELFRVKNAKTTTLWTGSPGEKAVDFQFSEDGNGLAFVVENGPEERQVRSIWYYAADIPKAVIKFRDGDSRIDRNLRISGPLEFSRNNQWLFFSLLSAKRSNIPQPDPDAVQVDVWSYKDRVIQPAQAKEHERDRFRAVVSVKGDSFQQLETGKEQLVSSSEVTGDVVVLASEGPEWWADARHHFLSPYSYSLRSLREPSKSFFFKSSSMENLSFSPDGRWIVYYDATEKNYFSYDIKSNSLHNITAKLPTSVSADYRHELPHWEAAPLGGWGRGDSSVLLYDNYDLWQVDLSGRRTSINVTRGYGLSHHVKLRLLEYRDLSGKESVFTYGDTLLLTGFNVDNKYNGFLRQVIGTKNYPEVLYMGPYVFYGVSSQISSSHAFDNGMRPLKASSAQCWIVKRQSDKEAPNYFLTKNFKQYKPLTQLKPQAKFNWLRAELIHYKQLDGKKGQAVLYKPEDFDPLKKYPVLFNYYEELTQRLYQFPKPEFMRANIDVAWFVSRGYLVVTPDIPIQSANFSGKTVGQWAYNSVVAAAKYLSKLPYVDKRHMGIQGHSLGGQETNYLITHTHLFAAASEMAGVSDEVSSYLNLLRNPDTELEYREDMYIKEAGQIRFGSTLWERKDFYLRESAVLSADHVTTPVLMVHNKRDESVSWRQAVELYMALRRLEKRVWLLQYDEEHHTIDELKNSLDYTIRVTQFFDYYLKEKLPPKWLTKGIPARKKGLETGYELDDAGKIP